MAEKLVLVLIACIPNHSWRAFLEEGTGLGGRRTPGLAEGEPPGLAEGEPQALRKANPEPGHGANLGRFWIPRKVDFGLKMPFVFISDAGKSGFWAKNAFCFH